ncbi:MAG TPA: hypothetical protein VFA81_00790 [Burkholderiales bacterium]|nr:hypothetical protein [Burkholderiales bacterium]
MRKVLAPFLALVFVISSSAALAGVAPNAGGQSMSGAKIKPASHSQESEKSEQTQDKEDHGSKEDKR